MHVYAVPVAPGRCRILLRFMTSRALPWPLRSLTLADALQWRAHLMQRELLDGDMLLLAMQVRFEACLPCWCGLRPDRHAGVGSGLLAMQVWAQD